MLIRERMAHKRPVFSFEFFPPKNPDGEAILWRSLRQLAPLEPDFVSVTYGAGGSTRERSIEWVARIKQEVGIEPMMHLTCVGATRDEIARILDRLGELDIRNVLALRGDPPKGATSFEATQDGFATAAELVAFIRSRGDFCIGAACYPEKHPESPSADQDLRALKQKVDAGCDFLVSQLFFDNGRFLDFSARARGLGIELPILAGIMPVTNVAQIKRFTALCGASLPDVLLTRLAELEDDPFEVFWTGVTYAAHQCRDLLEQHGGHPFDRVPHSVAGIHFYTLNRSPATRAIFEILRLSRAAH